jgi:hypothetical protein
MSKNFKYVGIFNNDILLYKNNKDFKLIKLLKSFNNLVYIRNNFILY